MESTWLLFPLYLWVWEMFPPLGILSYKRFLSLLSVGQYSGLTGGACLRPLYVMQNFQITPHQRGVSHFPYEPPTKAIHSKDDGLPILCFQFLNPTPLSLWLYTFQRLAVTGSCPMLRSWRRIESLNLEQLLSSAAGSGSLSKEAEERTLIRSLKSPSPSLHQLHQERCVHNKRWIRGKGIISSRSRTGRLAICHLFMKLN